jgi:hypothetical protein
MSLPGLGVQVSNTAEETNLLNLPELEQFLTLRIVLRQILKVTVQY